MTLNPKSFIERIASSLTDSFNSKVIFADPIESDGVTIIPVARVRYGFGAGIGKRGNDTGKFGKGAGGGVDAQPIGYIEIKAGEARFHAISQPISVPAVILAGGVASIFVFRGLRKLFRR